MSTTNDQDVVKIAERLLGWEYDGISYLTEKKDNKTLHQRLRFSFDPYCDIDDLELIIDSLRKEVCVTLKYDKGMVICKIYECNPNIIVVSRDISDAVIRATLIYLEEYRI